MAREPWFLAAERWAEQVNRRDEEQFHLSELTFATEAESWLNGDINECA